MADFLTDEYPEPHRLAALHALQIMDTATPLAFDRIVALACRTLNAKSALVSFIDGTRCWNSAVIGYPERETNRAHAFCSATIQQSDVLVVPDARADALYANFHCVKEYGIRFYAGAPITTSSGARVGVVAVLDTEPRDGLTHEERATLIDLAAMATIHLESRAHTPMRDMGASQARIASYVIQIAQAKNVEAAMASLISDCLTTFGGLTGRLWKHVESSGFQEVGCWGRAGNDVVAAADLAGRASVAAAVVQEHATRQIHVDEIADPDDPLRVIMNAEGTTRAIAVPTIIGEGKFVFIMTFSGNAGDASLPLEFQQLAESLAPVLRYDEATTSINWPIRKVPLIDAAQRRVDEQEARDRDASFRLMFEDNPLPMMLYDPATGRIHRGNAAVVTAYSYPHEEFTKLSIFDLVPVADRAEARAYIANLGSAPANSAWTHLSSTGDLINVQIVTRQVTFGGKRLRLAVIWDVTEVEQARDALRQSNQELLILAGQLQARTTELTEVNRRARLGMWRLPPGGGAAEWSDEMWEIFGRAPAAMGPDLATLLSWIAPGDRSRVQEIISQAAQEHIAHSFEFRAIQPQGNIRHCLADLRPNFGSGTYPAMLKGFCQDVTERKETELALLRSEKLKTIGQFTGGVAHDFNNLLTVIMLNVEEAIDMLEPEHALQPLLAPVLHASMRGSELTSQLLSYARRSPLEPMHVSMQDLFDGLNPLLDRILGDRFKLEVRHNLGEAEPFVDAAKLENAILNLVINARDAMVSGGQISIRTTVVALGPEGPAGWTDFVPGEYAAISVSDTGCGIPAELFPRVFEPFFTTKAVGKGSGLGLSMVYGFAKQSGGHAAITSDVTVGTTAVLYLPLHGQPNAAQPREMRRASKAVAPRMSALLVEDQPDVLKTLQRQLVALGFKVIVAADAARAMDHITTTGILDLLFTDVAIPGPIDGTQLAAIARQRHPDIRILLTSGYLDQNAAKAADLAGGTEFLQKPYTRADLSERLAAMFPVEGPPG